MGLAGTVHFLGGNAHPISANLDDVIPKDGLWCKPLTRERDPVVGAVLAITA